MMVMFMATFLSWWYGSGWIQVANSFKPRLNLVSSAFSVNQLLKTLFSPWRRIITYPGASLADRFHAWGDNLFSRTIGFIVRLFVLLAALLTCLAVALVTLIELIVWPLLPLSPVGFILAGVIW